jgi:hypothetical protein
MNPRSCTPLNDLSGRNVALDSAHGGLWEELGRRCALAQTLGTAEHAALVAALWHEFPEVFEQAAQARSVRKPQVSGRILEFPKPSFQTATQAKRG